MLKLWISVSVLSCLAVFEFVESKHSDIPAEIRAYVDNYVETVVLGLEQRYRAEIDELTHAFKTEIQSVKNEALKKEETQEQVINAVKTQLNEQNERIIKYELMFLAFETNESLENVTVNPISNKYENRKFEPTHKLKKDDVKQNTNNKRLIKRQNEVGPRVAFFATLTSDADSLGVNQVIPFNHAVTNIGNGFNAHQGTFIAPVDGIYVFSATLLSGDTYGHFVVNNVVVAKFDMYTKTLFAFSQQASQTIIVDLKKGQDVSVRNTVVGRTVQGDRYSNFSGFLLYGGNDPSIVG